MPNIRATENRQQVASRASSYWTKENMENATPVPLRTAPKDLLNQSGGQIGASRVVSGALPKSARRQAAQTVEVPNYSQFPFSCVGKLFMREGNRNFVGSAWVIGQQTIFSAAHCLFDDNGTFYDDVIFVPQFDNGQEPLGRFAAVQMAVDNRYTTLSGNHLNFDLGIAILDRPVGNDTGIVSFAENPISQIALGAQVTGVGYPANPPFDGTDMFQSTGSVVRDSAPGSAQERFFGAENNMTGGCSGGPWFDPGGVVVGLNSFVFEGEQPPIMHSPYFGQGFIDLVEWARENGGGVPNGDPPIPDIPSTPNQSSDSIKEGLNKVVAELNAIIDSL